MNGLLNYLLQMGAVSAILYGYYHFFLRNKKFHFYNRYYLLTAVLLSLIIPFINIPVYFTQQTANSTILQTLTIFSFGGDETVVTAAVKAPVLTFTQILYGIYLIVCVALLIRITVSVIRINRLYKSNPVEKLDQIFLVQTNEPGTPFSFFRWLFWNREIELDSESGQQIFRHELYHIRQKHSHDVFFMEFLTTILWFNPFFYLMKKELRAIHEFLADRAAVVKNEEWNYAELLLMQVLQTRQTIVNPFFHNQIKRRIAMITSSQKPKHQYIRKLMVLPLVGVLTLLFAFTYKEIKERRIALSDPIEQAIADTVPGNKEVVIWDMDPNLKEKTKKGLVFLSKAKTVMQADSIIFKMPNGKLNSTNEKSLIVLNGRVMTEGFTLKKQQIIAKRAVIYGENDPVAIQKYGERAKKGVIEFIEGHIVAETPSLEEVKIKEYPLNDPLIVLDGIAQVERGRQLLTSINPHDIESINVLKDRSATEKYGKEGTNGVIEIFTKGQFKTIPDKPIVDTALANTPIFLKVESSPSFVGGEPGWRKFLERNLDASVPITKGAPTGSYTTKVRFLVDTDGSIRNIEALTHHGFGMEEEVIKVIKTGPLWIPAKQNGRTVRAYKEQPVTFVITDDLGKEEIRVWEDKPIADKSLKDIVLEEKEIKKDESLNEVVVVGYPKSIDLPQLKAQAVENMFEKEGSLYPNPANKLVNIPISSTIQGKATIRVTTVKGEVAVTQNCEVIKGLNTITLNTSSLAKGAYFINVLLPDKGARTYKMIKE
jgi:TonB-dependent SusC/RagA subfamily outer membrane receptor